MSQPAEAEVLAGARARLPNSKPPMTRVIEGDMELQSHEDGSIEVLKAPEEILMAPEILATLSDEVATVNLQVTVHARNGDYSYRMVGVQGSRALIMKRVRD